MEADLGHLIISVQFTSQDSPGQAGVTARQSIISWCSCCKRDLYLAYVMWVDLELHCGHWETQAEGAII